MNSPHPYQNPGRFAACARGTSTANPSFSFVTLTQGTPEWLAWRRLGIGASDAPTILGENPWKTADALLQERLGEPKEFVPNAAMMRGTALEPEARARYIAVTGIEVAPVCLQSTHFPWLRASLDGFTCDGSAAVEIKCGESVYRRTAQHNAVPDYYYGQLQHALAVTGLQSIDFFCYLPGRPDVMVTVARDEAYIERLLEAEETFFAAITNAEAERAVAEPDEPTPAMRSIRP